MNKTDAKKITGLVAIMAWGIGCGATGPDDGGVDGDGTGTNGTCTAQASGVAANRIVARVTWPDSIGVVGGEGELVIWTKAELNFDGSTVTGSVAPCGSVLPVIQTKEIAGGHKVQPLIPEETWDLPSIPKTDANGTISGFNPGATISMQPAISLIGLTMDDPMSTWPSDWSALDTVDHDGDGAPGITGYSNTSNGFSAPPTGLFPTDPKASALYLATRSVIELKGQRDSCTKASGTAIVHQFDNHVIGCKLEGGGECDATQTSFIDNNRTVYEVVDATYEMQQLPAGATCADVRAIFN